MSTLRRTIWTLWLQGRSLAPPVIQHCIASWERMNPTWEVRVLDAGTVGRYVDVGDVVDLDRQAVTAASLSDIVRLLLLREYGGVWVDASLLCTRPLDDWLDPCVAEGFFAFSDPGPDRPVASWFLAAVEDDPLCAAWTDATADFWRGRARSDDYFWFHHLFAGLLDTDRSFRDRWARVPKVHAEGPHTYLGDRMYEPVDVLRPPADRSVPLVKLTHRIDPDRVRPGCVLDALGLLVPVAPSDTDGGNAGPQTPVAGVDARRVVGQKVATENIGDHLQVLAARQLLGGFGFVGGALVDRDEEIATGVVGEGGPSGTVPVVLHGWHKTNSDQWPPHPQFDPLYLGFHVRPHQAPTLLGGAAIDHYRANGPVGCRDEYTLGALRSRGVEAFLSNCLTLLFRRPVGRPELRTEVLVTSRDDRILGYLPDGLHYDRFVSHYSGSTDFDANLRQAQDVLDRYRTRTRLVVTTLLHSALPALAMGIPVVVFYPVNDAQGHHSDRERFSTLETMVPVHDLDDQAGVDWRGSRAPVADTKLALIDAFAALSARWGPPPVHPVGPWQPPGALPVPG